MTQALPLVVVEMGRPPADVGAKVGEQPLWFNDALGDVGPVKMVRPYAGEPLPPAGSFRGAVISGSWSMVTSHEDWSDRTADWLKKMMRADVPLLGICYGHQLMSWALGGEVDYHPQGSEVGQKAITLNERGVQDPLLAGLPPAFDAFLSHEQTVHALPPGAVVLGASTHDKHQIIRYSPTALSVQFHPEFTGKIMASIIESHSKSQLLKDEDRVAQLAGISETAQARAILRRFETFTRGLA